MQMNEIMWEEKRDIATLVALGAINRAHLIIGQFSFDTFLYRHGRLN